MEGLLQNIFQAQQKSDQHVSSSSGCIQHIQNICKEDLAKKSLTDTHTYTMIKIQKTLRFFLCALVILYLETTKTITWNKYSKHPLVPLLDYLHHTADTCRSGGVILKLNCDTHLAKLLSTFNFKT